MSLISSFHVCSERFVFVVQDEICPARTLRSGSLFLCSRCTCQLSQGLPNSSSISLIPNYLCTHIGRSPFHCSEVCGHILSYSPFQSCDRYRTLWPHIHRVAHRCFSFSSERVIRHLNHSPFQSCDRYRTLWPHIH